MAPTPAPSSRQHINQARLDNVARRLKRLSGSRERLLVEVGEQDRPSRPLAARDRLPDTARADDDNDLSLVHGRLHSALAVDHLLLPGLVALAARLDLRLVDLPQVVRCQLDVDRS